MKTTKNTPKAARKSTARRKTASPPEIDGWGYETREIWPAEKRKGTPRPVIVGHARHNGLGIRHGGGVIVGDAGVKIGCSDGLAIGQEPDAMRTAVVGFRGAGLTAGAAATQPPAPPSFR